MTMRTRRRLQRLERRAAVLPAPQPDECPDDEWVAWCHGGCSGPLPLAGPRPAKYSSEKEWQQSHRFLLALACASVGRDYPPGMTAEEHREVDDTMSFFASLDPTGELSLRQQVDLAPYAGVIEQFLTDPGGGIIPQGRMQTPGAKPTETAPAPRPTNLEPPKGPSFFKV